MLTGVGAGVLAAGFGLSAAPAAAGPSASSKQAAAVLDIADAEVGQAGEPKGYSKYNYASNWKSSMSSDHHAAWCAMFLSWCFDQQWGAAATKRAVGYQGGHSYPTGWSATWLWRDYLRSNDQWVGWEAAQPGDLVFFKFGSNGNPTDHVGMVADPHSTNTYTLIEGNVPGDDKRVVKYREYTRNSYLIAVYRPLWSAI
ncbi:hypothetical protein GCM10027440_19980 [Nocardiopsis coralliicola]